MKLIYMDILKQWMVCWQGTVIAGILFIVLGMQTKHAQKRQKPFVIQFFADGVYFYYLLHVTLLSRAIGSRREVALLPFAGDELMNGDFHYVIENVLFFIPFGILLCMTLRAYGKACNIRVILAASFLTSVSVEILQYVFSCGKSETDDVIANVTGAVIGYLLVRLKYWK